jgi:PAS domain S-box-containing protein
MISQHWYSRFLPFTLRRIAWLSIFIVFAISFFDITDWIFNLSLFSSIEYHFISMKMVTASCLVFLAFAVALARDIRCCRRNKKVSRVLASLVGLAGIITIVFYFIELKTGKEPSFANTPIISFFLVKGTRMRLFSAIIFVFIGLTVILLTVNDRRATGIAHGLILPVIVISYFFPVACMLGSFTFFEMKDIPLAMNTGIAFFFTCIAILCFRPDTWIMRKFSDDNAGSEMVRKVLPFLLIIPLIIGWLRIYFEKTGLFSSEVGVALVEVAYTFCFFWLVWMVAGSVNKTDEKRKMSEELMQLSEERYRNLFEYSVLPIWEEDLSLVKQHLDKLRKSGIIDFRAYFKSHEGEIKHVASLVKIVDVNKKSLIFFNVNSKGEIITNLLYYFNEESLGVFREKIIALAEGKTYFEGEMPLKMADGSVKFLLLHLSVMQGYERSLKKVLVTYVDITERKRMEEELVRSKDEWVETFNLIPDLIAILDDQHRIVRANKAMAEKLCTSPDEISGLHCYECVHGADAPPAFCPHSMMLRDNMQHLTEYHEANLGGDFLVSVTPILDEKG